MRFFSVFLLGLLFSISNIQGAIPFHNVLKADSLNLFPANIRINQAGYVPSDEGKRAFVTSYGDYLPEEGDEFYLINSSTKEVVYKGKLEDSGIDFGRGSFHIKAYVNSITEWNPPYPLTSNYNKEHIFFAKFGDFKSEGKFNVVCDDDTSHTFRIDKYLYNDLFNTELKFLAFQRCGEATWAHEACHTHDGEAVGHDGELVGGWHDCGDHVKFSLTMGYTSLMISLIAATHEDKLTDQWNAPMNDSIFTDGIPDLLYEVWNVSKYYMRLYEASKADGIWPKKMYHVIGNGDWDHDWWGRPEWQDNMPQDQGGRPRPVLSNMGAEVAAKMGATLAFFSKVWEKYDKNFADKCLAASEDLYENYVLTHLGDDSGGDHGSFYSSNGMFEDEIGAHLVALLWATKDAKYKKDLLENTTYGSSTTSKYEANLFSAGWFAHRGDVAYHPGGWPQDWENVYAYTLYGFKKLIIPDLATAKLYGFSEEEYNELSIRTANAFLKNLSAGGLIKDETGVSTDLNVVAKPYNLPNFDMAWGFNRYNLGMSITGFLFYDAFGDQKYKITEGLNQTNLYKGLKDKEIDYGRWSILKEQAVRHLDYILGLNPWDVSFVMGVGTKTLNHPHNRTASSEAENGSAQRYNYTVPIGALMGGINPTGEDGGLVLKEDVIDYVVDETCIDYSMVLMAMTAINSAVLPPDTLAPQLLNHGWSQIDSQAVLVSWGNNELSKDLLYYSKDKNALIKFLQDGILTSSIKMMTPAKQPGAISDFQKKQLVTINNLVQDIPYYYVISVEDLKGNAKTYDNGGELFTFTLSNIKYEISDITICNITSNSAEITWRTNEKSPSSVIYRIQGSTDFDTVLFDDESPSTFFHKVTLKNLESDTNYEYWVKSGSTKEGPEVFKTEFEFARLEINACMEDNGNIWFTVNNKENTRDYSGLEFRIYIPSTIKTGPYTYWAINPAQYYYNGKVDASFSNSNITKNIVEENGYNYIDIKLDDSFVFQANGMLKLKLDISQLDGMNYDDMLKGWSLREHTKDEAPFPSYQGIGYPQAPSESNMIRTAPDPWVGQLVLLPTNYITAYQNGQHIYGYYPDYNFDNATLKEPYDVTVKVLEPVNTLFGNSTTIIGDKETKKITIKGTVSIVGEISGNFKKVGNIRVNDGTAIFDVDNDGNNVEFSYDYTLKEGLNNILISALDDNDGSSCNSGVQSIIINYKRGNVTQSKLLALYGSGSELPKTSDGSGLYQAIIGETQLYFSVNDSDENVDETIGEKVLVTLYAPTDTEQVYLPELGVNTGVFTNAGNIADAITISKTPSKSFQTSDRIITANPKDTIIAKYIDDDDNNDISIKKIVVREDIPIVEFTDSIGEAVPFYRISGEKVYLKLRDKTSYEDSTGLKDSLVLTITNKSGKDSEKIVLKKHPLNINFYKSEKGIDIVMGTDSKMVKNDGKITVEMDDSLFVSYEVNGEVTSDIVKVVSPNPLKYIKNLIYHVAPNPILTSQFKSGKFTIKVAYPDSSVKFSIEYLQNMGIKDLSAEIYDINGNIIKRFPELSITGANSGEDELNISFDTYWNGCFAGTNKPVQTGVYFIRFKLTYDNSGTDVQNIEIVKIYIINDLKR